MADTETQLTNTLMDWYEVRLGDQEPDVFDFMAGGRKYDVKQAGSAMWHPDNDDTFVDAEKMSVMAGAGVAAAIMQTDMLENMNDMLPLKRSIIHEDIPIQLLVMAFTYSHLSGDIQTGTVRSVYVPSEDYSFGGDGNSSDGTTSSASSNVGSVGDIGSPTFGQGLVGMGFSALGVPGVFGNIAGVITVNAVTGDMSMTSSQIGGAMVSNVTGMVASKTTQAIASAFGVTNVATTMGIGMVVGAVMGELAEMAMGLDTQFGYGGTVVGKYGGKSYSTEMKGNFGQRSAQWGKDVIGEISGFFSGDAYASQNEIDDSHALDSMRNDMIDDFETIDSAKADQYNDTLQGRIDAVEEKMRNNFEDMHMNNPGADPQSHADSEGELEGPDEE